MMKVKVRVYDLAPWIKVFKILNMGIYHSSVIIECRGHEDEISYGGQAYFGDTTGVSQNIKPNKNFIDYELGEVKGDFLEIYKEFCSSKQWKSRNYSILYNNCNDFAYHFSEALVEKEKMKNFPQYILRAQHIGRFLYNISLSYSSFFKNFPGFIPKENSEREKQNCAVANTPLTENLTV